MQRLFLPHKQVIYIQPQAPTKPHVGAACNGCGLCCLAEPCPLGVLLSRSRVGPCKALVWQTELQQYRCGALGNAAAPVATALIGLRGRVLGWVTRLRARLVVRWIAAGAGCDCDLEATPSRTISVSSPTESDPPHD